MKLILKLAGIVLLAILGLLLLVFVVRTAMVQWSEPQKTFKTGTVPSPVPDGFYPGFVSFYRGGWRGKSFAAATNTGINFFGDANEPRFPFKTYVAKGLRDADLDVLRIDYGDPVNPWWVRLVTDEIVQVAPNKYLGKIHLRVIPGFPFAIGFFRLER